MSHNSFELHKFSRSQKNNIEYCSVKVCWFKVCHVYVHVFILGIKIYFSSR